MLLITVEEKRSQIVNETFGVLLETYGKMRAVYNLFFLVIYLTACSIVNGCGFTPAGQETTINFALSDFKLPAVMAYSEDVVVRSKVPTISTSKSQAETVVRNLIMQSVEYVLYQQGRSAFLSDSVISLILQQLEIQVSYDPLNCEGVITDPTLLNGNGAVAMKLNCIIVGGTIPRTCMHMMANMCSMANNLIMNSKLVDSKHLSISGSFKTSNVIMAAWSNQMWENVLNRVLREITSRPNGSNFV